MQNRSSHPAAESANQRRVMDAPRARAQHGGPASSALQRGEGVSTTVGPINTAWWATQRRSEGQVGKAGWRSVLRKHGSMEYHIQSPGVGERSTSYQLSPGGNTSLQGCVKVLRRSKQFLTVISGLMQDGSLARKVPREGNPTGFHSSFCGGVLSSKSTREDREWEVKIASGLKQVSVTRRSGGSNKMSVIVG